jgi:predicted metal-binding membrane protein
MAVNEVRQNWPGRATTLPLVAGLVALFAASAAVTIWQAGASDALMDVGVPMGLGTSGRLGLTSAAAFLGIWLAMMVAMMLPSVWPAVVLYASAGRSKPSGSAPLFVLGYLAIWEGFGLLAYAIYVGVGAAGAGVPMLAERLPLVSGAVLVAAGLYQLTPLKRTCLGDCRAPLASLRADWSDGPLGGLTVGLRHGVHCLGSSGGFMVALIALGAMDLRWMVAAGVAIALEKLGPRTQLVPVVLGLGLIALGVATALGSGSGMGSMG